MAMKLYEGQLRVCLKDYRHSDAAKRDAIKALRVYTNLHPKTDTLVFDNGKSKQRTCLEGTVPVIYRGSTYHIPVAVWLLISHPKNSPIIFVKPTPDMDIEPGKHVDSKGKVHLHYMDSWKKGESNLLGLIKELTVVFGEAPPVRARLLPTPPPSFSSLQPLPNEAKSPLYAERASQPSTPDSDSDSQPSTDPEPDTPTREESQPLGESAPQPPNTEPETLSPHDGTIMREPPNVHWEDVVGLESTKEALKEAVVLPITFPHLFTGTRTPWRGILLFGPPGTGKSYVAKALASEASSAALFSVSSADLVCKWLGESERLLKNLFDTARENKPSIIFLDDVDDLCPAATDTSEPTHRLKVELIHQMSGVGQDNDGVFVLATTNVPWMMDPAIYKRFEKRIYVQLPGEEERTALFRLHMAGTTHFLTEDDFSTLGKATDGYSSADINVLVRQALMLPIRKIENATYFKRIRGPSPYEDGVIVDDFWLPCFPADSDAVQINWSELDRTKIVEPAVTMADMMYALDISKPSVTEEDLVKHRRFLETSRQEG